jgi:hypothetical protein
MLHSAQDRDNYGDHSCVMGSFMGLRHYNAPVSWSAGTGDMQGWLMLVTRL